MNRNEVLKNLPTGRKTDNKIDNVLGEVLKETLAESFAATRPVGKRASDEQQKRLL